MNNQKEHYEKIIKELPMGKAIKHLAEVWIGHFLMFCEIRGIPDSVLEEFWLTGEDTAHGYFCTGVHPEEAVNLIFGEMA